MSTGEPSTAELMELQGCMAAAMHEKAKQRMGRLSAAVILVSIVISLLLGSFWPFVIGLAMSFLISYYIWSSCFRYLEHETGMPRAVQMQFKIRYRQDRAFAEKVDSIFPQMQRRRR